MIMLATTACGVTLRTMIPPVFAAFTPAVNVSVVTPATVSSPAVQPAARTPSDPISLFATSLSPLVSPCPGNVTTDGDASENVTGRH